MKRKYQKPVKLDMDFDEALRRLCKVDMREVDKISREKVNVKNQDK